MLLDLFILHRILYSTLTIGTERSFQGANTFHVILHPPGAQIHFNSLWPSDTVWHEDMFQHWPMLWLDVRRHQAITWPNIGLSTLEFCGTHIEPIAQKVVNIWNYKKSLKNTLVKLLPHNSICLNTFPDPHAMMSSGICCLVVFVDVMILVTYDVVKCLQLNSRSGKCR